MPWKETYPVKERVHFLRDQAGGVLNFTELCRHYKVSRKPSRRPSGMTGHKWLHRFEEEGIEGLERRSRKSHTSPNQLDKGPADILLQTRPRHPKLGPKKIKGLLELVRPSVDWVNAIHVLAGEYVGLEGVEFKVWSFYFGPLLLGRFSEEELHVQGTHAYNQPTE